MAVRASTDSPAYLRHYDVQQADTVAHASVRRACENLLRAQLRAGMHVLPFEMAKQVGARLGMAAGTVKPGTDYPKAAQR